MVLALQVGKFDQFILLFIEFCLLVPEFSHESESIFSKHLFTQRVVNVLGGGKLPREKMTLLGVVWKELISVRSPVVSALAFRGYRNPYVKIYSFLDVIQDLSSSDFLRFGFVVYKLFFLLPQ